MSTLADCQVLNCKRPITARGLCKAHYNRWYRHGSTLPKAAIREIGENAFPGKGLIKCTLCDRPVVEHELGPRCPMWNQL